MSRCTPDDIPQMVSVYIAAFQETDFDYWWSSSVDTMRRWNEGRFRLRFREPTQQQFKVVDDVTGQLVAFVRWVVPEDMKGLAQGFKLYEDREDGEFGGAESEWMENAPEGSNEELYTEFFGAVRGMGAKWESSKKLELSLLCTHPAYHGRGIAAALLRSVFAVADAEGIVTYVDALSNATRIYEHYGFKAVDQLEFDTAKAGREGTVTIDVMIRQPKTNSPIEP